MGDTDTQTAQSTKGAAKQTPNTRRRGGLFSGIIVGSLVSFAGLLVLNEVLPKPPMVPDGPKVEVVETPEEPVETAEAPEPQPEPEPASDPIIEVTPEPEVEPEPAVTPEQTSEPTEDPVETIASDPPVSEPEDPVVEEAEPEVVEPEEVVPDEAEASPEPEPVEDVVEIVTAPEAAEPEAPEEPEAETGQAETETDLALAPAEAEPEPVAEDTGPAWLVNAIPFEAAGDTPLIGLILERPGNNDVTPEQIFALSLPVTLAIVPDGAPATTLGKQAHEAGFEVIAHLPMEPRGAIDPGPDALRVEMSSEEAVLQTRRLIARLPDAVAASNFMGSKATESEALMQAVIGTLNEDGVAFIDSRTSPRSKAFGVAETLGGRFARNSRFIPEEVTPDQAYRLLERAADEARQRGGTVLIGPANRDMLLGLQRWALERNGKKARLAPISAILRLEGGR
ncbi:MAG: divergent polysaccharide deacetylase family protein [Pseudomonadota bacterium]